VDQKVHETAEKLFRSEYEKLTEIEKHVAHHITARTPISTNVVQDLSKTPDFWSEDGLIRSLLSGDLGSLSQYLWV